MIEWLMSDIHLYTLLPVAVITRVPSSSGEFLMCIKIESSSDQYKGLEFFWLVLRVGSKVSLISTIKYYLK